MSRRYRIHLSLLFETNTLMQASSHGLLLAIKDITSLIYKHASISDDFGHVGQGKKQNWCFRQNMNRLLVLLNSLAGVETSEQ